MDVGRDGRGYEARALMGRRATRRLHRARLHPRSGLPARSSRPGDHRWAQGLPSALSHKFDTPLPAKRVALEGPAKGPGGPVPAASEAIDAAGHRGEGLEADPPETLAIENAEPELDLIEPRGMKRQELDADSMIVRRHPGLHVGMPMDRQVVGHHDQAAPGPPPAKRLKEIEELLMAAPPSDEHRHAARADIQAGQHRHDPVAPIGLFDTRGLSRSQGTSGMDALQNLELGLLVDADYASTARRMQVKADNPLDLATKLGVGAVKPPPHPMRFEIGLAQPSMHRALTDGADEAPLDRGASQGPHGPMSPDPPELGAWTARHREDVMALLRGKTGLAGPGVPRPPAHSGGREQTGRATCAPTPAPGLRRGRWPWSPPPGRPATHSGRAPLPTPQSGPPDTGVATPVARWASTESTFLVSTICPSSLVAFVLSAYPRGYVTERGYRIYGTVH